MIPLFLTNAAKNIANFWQQLVADHPASGIPDPDVATWDNLRLYGWNSILICILMAVALWILSRKLQKSKDNTRHLGVWFIIAWVFAFIVYDVGMYTGQYISLLTNAPMAVIHAFETFLLGSDVSAIHDSFHNSCVFMLCFSLSHALSACVSMLFLIKVFGFNLKQKWRLIRETRKSAEKRETFILWGVDSVTFKMVDSINAHFKNESNPSYRIIVVNKTDNSGDSSGNAIGINKIFNIILFSDPELRELQKSGCFIANLSRNDLECSSDETEDILHAKLHLKSLSKILRDRTSERIHLLFLSDNEKENLHDVSVLLKDSTLNAFSKNRKAIFYCHARVNGVHRAIEDLNQSANMEVRVFDSSHYNVELLKENQTVLPVNFVEVEKDATVSSPFNSMVIGFSEVGQDAVRFLYEFGAFVKPGGNDDEAVRSDFHLDVIDNRMEEKAGVFVANAPSINPSLAYLPEMRNPEALIELHNIDCRSAEFFKLLERKMPTLNYIVIATENDELNMTMAVRMFRAATRFRKNLDNFCILVRVHDDSDGHFEKIAQYYNMLWASQQPENIDGKEPNITVRKTDRRELPVYIFGRDKDVYTYDIIINEGLIKKAADYSERYEAATNPKYKTPQETSGMAWYVNERTLMQTAPDNQYHPAYACMMRLRRTQGQDISNCWHILTKELLRTKAMAKLGISDISWPSLQRPLSETQYTTKTGKPIDSRIARLLTVLAQTEHLRWNASHEILGYVYSENGKNEIKLHHDCLTDWKNLGKSTRAFDFNIVDLSCGIIGNDIKIKTLINE